MQNKYQVLSKIGEGSFGVIFKGIYKKTGEPVAIKTEKKNGVAKLIKAEASLLHYLQDSRQYTPPVLWYGMHNEEPTLIIPYYETSLHDYMTLKGEIVQEERDKWFNQMVEVLDYVHSKFVIHRDIKPQNFMFRPDGGLALIDFGMATIFVDENKIPIIAKNDHSTILGTPKFMSYFIHIGNEPSVRDDFISAGYIYLWMENSGHLVWESLPTVEPEESKNIYSEMHILHYKNQERARLKSWTSIQEICRSKQMIEYFMQFYQIQHVFQSP